MTFEIKYSGSPQQKLNGRVEPKLATMHPSKLRTVKACDRVTPGLFQDACTEVKPIVTAKSFLKFLQHFFQSNHLENWHLTFAV